MHTSFLCLSNIRSIWTSKTQQRKLIHSRIFLTNKNLLKVYHLSIHRILYCGVYPNIRDFLHEQTRATENSGSNVGLKYIRKLDRLVILRTLESLQVVACELDVISPKM